MGNLGGGSGEEEEWGGVGVGKGARGERGGGRDLWPLYRGWGPAQGVGGPQFKARRRGGETEGIFWGGSGGKPQEGPGKRKPPGNFGGGVGGGQPPKGAQKGSSPEGAMTGG